MYLERNVFCPRIDDTADPAEIQFEKHGPSRSIRKYTDLPDDLPYEGDAVHGDVEDFMGESLEAKYSYHIGDGATFPCVNRGVKRFGLDLAVLCDVPKQIADPGNLALALQCPPRQYDKNKVGLGLAMKCERVYPYDGIALALAMKCKNEPPIAPLNKFGLDLALQCRQLPPPYPLNKIGLDLALQCRQLPPPYPLNKIGLDLATQCHTTPPPYETCKIALDLATQCHTAPPPYETCKIALDLAMQCHDSPPLPETCKIALALAMKCTASGDGPPPGGGPTCADATLITPGIYGPYDITGSTTTHWFKYAMPLFTNWHMRYTVNSGSGANFYVYYGPDCDHLTEEQHSTVSDCDSQFFTYDVWHWLKVVGPMMGTVNYTIDMGSTNCMGM